MTTETDKSNSGPESSIWYFLGGSQQFGPVDAETIKAGLKKGRFSSSTLVWREGFPEWVRLGDVGELSTSPSEAAPPTASARAMPSAARKTANSAAGALGLVIALFIMGALYWGVHTVFYHLNGNAAIDRHNLAVDAYNRGIQSQTYLKNPDSAIADYSRALALDSTMAAAYLNRGVLRIQKGDTSSGVRDFEKSALVGGSIDPSSPDTVSFDAGVQAHFNLGLLKLAKGDTSGASNEFFSAASTARPFFYGRDSSGLRAHYQLAVIALARRNRNAALLQLDAAGMNALPDAQRLKMEIAR